MSLAPKADGFSYVLFCCMIHRKNFSKNVFVQALAGNLVHQRGHTRVGLEE
jgi:hypothetical protein